MRGQLVLIALAWVFANARHNASQPSEHHCCMYTCFLVLKYVCSCVAQSFRLLFKLRSRQSLASTIINDNSREVYAVSGILKRAIATGNEDRHAKLAALGKSSFVSQAGLATLLKTVSYEGLADAFSRASQYRARKAVCDTI